MVILRGTEGREAGPSPAFCGQWQRLLCRGSGSYVGAFTAGLYVGVGAPTTGRANAWKRLTKEEGKGKKES